MDRNSDEYKKFKSEYEAKEQYREDHPEEYPWFVYFQFGWHHMTYMSDAEVEEAVKFYKGMFESHDSKGNKTWQRIGRQPIYMVRSRGVEQKWRQKNDKRKRKIEKAYTDLLDCIDACRM